VALRAGVDQQVIRRHWPDSRVLLLEATLTRARDAVPIPDEGSLSADLRHFGRSIAAATGTTFGRQWFRRLIPGGYDADLSHVAPDFWAFETHATREIFRRAVERGEVRGDVDQDKAARILLAALTYYVVFYDSPMPPEFAEDVCKVILNGTAATDSSGVLEDLHSSEQTRALLRMTCDALIDPIALIEAKRDHDGHIVDFVFREVNPAACTYLRHSRSELLGASLSETVPDFAGSGLLARYMAAMDTGKPLLVEDLPYFSRRYDTVRRFDIRARHANADCMSVI